MRHTHVSAAVLGLGCFSAAVAGPVWDEGDKDAGPTPGTARTVSNGSGGQATKVNGATSTALVGEPDLIDLFEFKFAPNASTTGWSIKCEPGWDVELFLFRDYGQGVVHLLAAADDISATNNGAQITSNDVSVDVSGSIRYFLGIAGRGAKPGYLNPSNGVFVPCFPNGLPADWTGILVPSSPRFDGWQGAVTTAGAYTNNVAGIEIILADDCSDAALLQEGANLLNTTAATTTALSYDMACSFDGQSGMGRDVWFFFDPACAGQAEVRTCDFVTFDTVIVVYEVEAGGACPTDPTPLACNDDASGGCTSGSMYASHVTFDVDACHRYYVRVGGYCGTPGTNGLCSLASSGTGSVGFSPPNCAPSCPATTDVNGDGIVDGADLTLLLSTWGSDGSLGQ